MCAITVNGRDLLASASSDETVRLWDPQTGTCKLTLPTHYPALGTSWVTDSLVIGLSAGILVVKPHPGG